MRVSKVVLGFFLTSISCFPTAAIIDFEDVPIYPNFTSENFTSRGFNFTLHGAASTVVNYSEYCEPKCPSNGSNTVLAPYGNLGGGNSSLFMTTSDNSIFTFNGFDGAGSFNFNDSYTDFIPNQIDVTGVQLNGNVVYESFLIDKSSNANGALNFTSYFTTNDFSNLVSLTFGSNGSVSDGCNGFSIDNVVVNAVSVPEPSTTFLLLVGLIAMGVTRRNSAK